MYCYYSLDLKKIKNKSKYIKLCLRFNYYYVLNGGSEKILKQKQKQYKNIRF